MNILKDSNTNEKTLKNLFIIRNKNIKQNNKRTSFNTVLLIEDCQWNKTRNYT